MYKELSLVTIKAPPDSGGGGKRFYNYARYFVGINNIKLNFITSSNTRINKVNTLKLMKYKYGFLYKVLIWLPYTFIRLIYFFILHRQTKYLLISCRDPLCICVALICILLKKDYYLGTTLFKYDDEETLLKSNFSSIYRLILANSSAFIVQSSLFLLEKKSVAKKIYVIPNGIETKIKLNQTIKSRSKKFQEFEFQKVFLMITIGRISKRKNTMEILRIFSEILNYDKSARLIIIGPYDKDCNYFKKCNNFVRDKNLIDKVFFTGFLENPQEYLSVCDVYISASRQEGIPNAILEAMISKKSIIMRKINITSELLLGEYLSSKFTYENFRQAVNLIKILIDEPFYKKNIGEKLYNQVQKFDIKKIINQYDNIIFN